MAKVKLSQVISARNSARNRLRSLSNTRVRRNSYNVYGGSPLKNRDFDVFNEEVARIENIYKDMIRRMNTAIEDTMVTIE